LEAWDRLLGRVATLNVAPYGGPHDNDVTCVVPYDHSLRGAGGMLAQSLIVQ